MPYITFPKTATPPKRYPALTLAMTVYIVEHVDSYAIRAYRTEAQARAFIAGQDDPSAYSWVALVVEEE